MRGALTRRQRHRTAFLAWLGGGERPDANVGPQGCRSWSCSAKVLWVWNLCNAAHVWGIPLHSRSVRPILLHRG